MSLFESIFGLSRDLNAENFNLLGAKTVGAFQEFSNGNSGSAATIQWSIAQFQSITLTANCTLTFGSAPAGVCIVRLRLVQDATGSRTVTWPAGLKWQQSSAPTLSTTPNAEDFVTLYYNGSAYFATPSLGYATVPTPATHTPTQTAIIFDGDSITVGVGSSPVTSYPYLASLNFFPGYGPAYANVAIAGETIDGMVTNLPTNVYPRISAAHTAGQLALVSVFGGTNDIAISGHTAAQVETSITTYANDVTTTGGADVVVFWTLLPRNVAGFETTRLTYNAWLRANFASIGPVGPAYYLIDIGGDPTLGPLASCTNSQLSADGTHPTTFGYGIIAGYVAATLMSNQSQSTLTNLSASSGSHTGGTSVTLTGTRFTKAYQVVLGGVPAATFAINSDTSIAATTGAVVGGGTGVGLASVVGPNGGAIFSSGFTYT